MAIRPEITLELAGIVEETPSLIKDGKWVTLKVKVVQIWDNTYDKITQTGLIGDETGILCLFPDRRKDQQGLYVRRADWIHWTIPSI